MEQRGNGLSFGKEVPTVPAFVQGPAHMSGFNLPSGAESRQGKQGAILHLSQASEHSRR